jgi:hypothetical protein
MCREREINIVKAQSRFQKESRQTSPLTNAPYSITQHEKVSSTQYNNNGGGETPITNPSIPPASSHSIIPRLTCIETFTVHATALIIANTVLEFYRGFKKKDASITIDRSDHTLDLEGKLVEEILAFLES